MGMSAGGTPVPFYADGMGDRNAFIQFHQISVIKGKRFHTSNSITERAGTVRQTDALNVLFKPLAVCESYLMKLAKDCKKTYHR